MLASSLFTWGSLQNPQKKIDLNNFFENSAYQNLFFELKSNQKDACEHEDEDTSTNAPESRTVSGLSVFNGNEKAKIEEKAQSTEKILKFQDKIKEFLDKPVDDELKERFKIVYGFDEEKKKE